MSSSTAAARGNAEFRRCAAAEPLRAARRFGGLRRATGTLDPLAATLWVLLLLAPARGAGDDALHKSPDEINQDVSDPVSLTWSLKLKNTVTFKDVGSNGDHAEYQLQFQPTMPMWVSRDWKLIVRPQFTLVDDTPYESKGEVLRTTGVGDTILDTALSPKLGPWLLGLGPTFVFPTANLDQTGKGKWQAGPVGVLGYRRANWLALLIAQQWWSFAGGSDRPAVSNLNLQYIVNYVFGDGWSVGTSPTIKFNWRASSGNQVNFPIGPTVGKVVKLGGVAPVKLELQGLYVPVYPAHDGERFIVQLQIIPVVPAPIGGGQ